MHAIHADALADSVGLCLHPENNAYKAIWASVLSNLNSATVRHARVGMGPPPNTNRTGSSADYLGRLASLSATNNIKLCVVAAPTLTNLALIEGHYIQTGGNWAAVEGPNEPNMTAGWGPATAAFQQQLYSAIKKSSLLGPGGLNIQVAGPSITGTGAGTHACGDLSPCVDYGNWHPYVNGALPEHQVMDIYVSDAKAVYGSKPLIATEFGYNSSLAQVRIQAAPDDIIVAYLPRAFLTNFSKGFIRSYWHHALTTGNPNTADPQAGYGLISVNGFVGAKWLVLKSLLSVFNDIGTPYTPLDVDVTVSGGGASLKTMLFQKRDGTNLLAVWQALPLWDTATYKYINVAPQPVTIKLPVGKTAAKQLAFNNAGGVATTALTVTNGTVTVNASGFLTVVQF